MIGPVAAALIFKLDLLLTFPTTDRTAIHYGHLRLLRFTVVYPLFVSVKSILIIGCVTVSIFIIFAQTTQNHFISFRCDLSTVAWIKKLVK